MLAPPLFTVPAGDYFLHVAVSLAGGAAGAAVVARLPAPATERLVAALVPAWALAILLWVARS